MDPNSLELDFKERYIRLLCDKSSTKRRSVSTDLINLATSYKEQGYYQVLEYMVRILVDECLCSTNPTIKKGGLVGLSAIILGICDPEHSDVKEEDAELTKTLVKLSIPPLLECFTNYDSRIRFYAAESLVNIIKASRSYCFDYFESIFDGICVLCTDVESDVKNSAGILNNILKETVLESNLLDINKFKTILKRYKSFQSPYVRKLLLSWIRELNQTNAYDFIPILPYFLDGLIEMLTDRNVEVKREADSLLTTFLKEITSRNAQGVNMNELTTIIIDKVVSPDDFVRFDCVTCLQTFIQLGNFWKPPYAELIHCLYLLLKDKQKEITDIVDKCISTLLKNLENTQDSVNFDEFVPIICEGLISNEHKTIKVSLKILCIIILKGHQDYCQNEQIKNSLLSALEHSDENVISDVVNVLVLVTNNGIELNVFLPNILRSFHSNASFLETRGCLILRTLCKNISAETVYSITAKTLLSYEDKSVASLIVHMLTIILLTAQETASIRLLLRSCCSEEYKTSHKDQENKGEIIFKTLYTSWCYNPISVLALCWLVEDYQLAYHIISLLGKEEFSLSLLMQADKLVQILESPVYLHLRLHLVDPQYPAIKPLLQSLFGFLMIFPQSDAYKTLQSRLSGVLPLHLALNNNQSNTITEDNILLQNINLFEKTQQERLNTKS